MSEKKRRRIYESMQNFENFRRSLLIWKALESLFVTLAHVQASVFHGCCKNGAMRSHAQCPTQNVKNV